MTEYLSISNFHRLSLSSLRDMIISYVRSFVCFLLICWIIPKSHTHSHPTARTEFLGICHLDGTHAIAWQWRVILASASANQLETRNRKQRKWNEKHLIGKRIWKQAVCLCSVCSLVSNTEYINRENTRVFYFERDSGKGPNDIRAGAKLTGLAATQSSRQANNKRETHSFNCEYGHVAITFGWQTMANGMPSIVLSASLSSDSSYLHTLELMATTHTHTHNTIWDAFGNENVIPLDYPARVLI